MHRTMSQLSLQLRENTLSYEKCGMNGLWNNGWIFFLFENFSHAISLIVMKLQTRKSRIFLVWGGFFFSKTKQNRTFLSTQASTFSDLQFWI